MDKNEKAIQSLQNGIIKYVDRIANKLPFDKTYTGIITAVTGTKYSVKIGNIIYENIKTSGGTCVVNDFVWILVPQNNYNKMFILKF